MSHDLKPVRRGATRLKIQVATFVWAGVVAVAMIFISGSARAQGYSIDWYTIDGGGGTSTGGVYSVSGTIGQPDAGVMSGGNYTLAGGFWSILAAVQTTNAPYLSVFYSTTNTAVVYWPLPDTGWVLQYNSNLSNPGGWTDIPGPYPGDGTRHYHVEAVPAGNKFYRLHLP